MIKNIKQSYAEKANPPTERSDVQCFIMQFLTAMNTY